MPDPIPIQIREVYNVYKFMLIDSIGMYKPLRREDVTIWRNLLSFCEDNKLNSVLLIATSFDYHRTNFRSTPYPNMIYTAKSVERYKEFVSKLLKKYPDGVIPIRSLLRSYSIAHTVQSDCYNIKLVQKFLDLPIDDAALSIFNSLSLYTRVINKTLKTMIYSLKDTCIRIYYPIIQELTNNKGLQDILTATMDKELYGREYTEDRDIQIRSIVSDQNIIIVPTRY